MTKHPYFFGIILSTTGFTLWTIGDSFIKIVSESGIPASVICALSSLVGIFVLIIFSTLRQNFHKLIPKNKRAQIILAFLGFGCNLCNATALRHLSLTS